MKGNKVCLDCTTKRKLRKKDEKQQKADSTTCAVLSSFGVPSVKCCGQAAELPRLPASQRAGGRRLGAQAVQAASPLGAEPEGGRAAGCFAAGG